MILLVSPRSSFKFHPIIGNNVGVGIYTTTYYHVLMATIVAIPKMTWTKTAHVAYKTNYESSCVYATCESMNACRAKTIATISWFESKTLRTYLADVTTWMYDENDNRVGFKNSTFIVDTGAEKPTPAMSKKVCENVRVYTIPAVLTALGYETITDEFWEIQ